MLGDLVPSKCRHTPGSICLYERKKRILLSGDTLFDEKIGRTDLQGSDKNKLLLSLNKLLSYDVQYLLPGHGYPKIGGFSFHLKQMIVHFGEKRFILFEELVCFFEERLRRGLEKC